jgi:hypothetical protein
MVVPGDGRCIRSGHPFPYVVYPEGTRRYPEMVTFT